ncbi:iron ABC transporter permease [Leucobacter chromiireducens subsp. solipictus]|uniref:Iron ABC transporter permease n=1 Tax=Leucobacter chromiireducens subsp. solipictus TaxID=398235 RepID=A0ABS1SFW0_9MICO|nr:iron ABC transporter permease [Leucobacter chromiireducens]MBL3679429.1 iron ABC transporter permease [Leucobacter chromiireducens subsp. solipictus]
MYKIGCVTSALAIRWKFGATTLSTPRQGFLVPRSRLWLTAAISALLAIAAAVASLMVGIVTLPVGETLTALFQPDAVPQRTSAVIWSIRLPRVLVAMLVGAALATVGVVMQAILRNPLAEPGITGVSAGAAVGAVASITLGFTGSARWGIPIAAFVGAAIVTLILQLVLQTRRDLGSATVVLIGVSLSALAGALINILIANASDDALVRSAMFWLAGDLELRDWQHVLIAVVPILAGIAWLASRFRQLDALALGDQIAATSGVHVHRERFTLLLVASLVTGAAVAVSGIISFVGLVVPHAMRLLIGASHARLLPLSALGGALFMVVADTIARTAFGPVVVQTGVVAALIGAPVFLILLLRKRSSA